VVGSGFIGPVVLVLLVLIKVIDLFRTRFTKGVWIDKTNSNIYSPDGKLKKKNIIPILGNWYGNTAQVFLFSVAFKYATLGGLNQGIVPSLTLFASFFNAIVFYLVFKERLSCPNITGMIVAFACGVLLAIDSALKKGQSFVDENGLEQSKGVYSFYSLGLAFLVPFGFTFKHFVIRKFQGGYDYHWMPIDSAVLECLTSTIFLFAYAEPSQITWPRIWWGGLIGAL
jgi:hypothetical protein